MFEKKYALYFLRPQGQRLWARYLSIIVPSRVPAVRSCLLAHVYYPNLLREILALQRNFPYPVDLHITLRPEIEDEVRRLIPSGVNAIIHVHENRGRDIAPTLALLDAGVFDHYDAVLKVHTKRSPHVKTGSLRRRLLFAFLAGQPRQVLRVLRLFERCDKGMVGWGYLFHRDQFYWYAVEAHVRDLCARMEIKAYDQPLFFEGTMFWFRPAALAPLRRLALEIDEFEPEPSPPDGCLHHAVERVFCYAAMAAGYKVLSDNGKNLASSI